MNFTETTHKVTKLLSKTEKKQFGFFVTPPEIIHRVLTSIQPLIKIENPHILEPSCGTCEFILATAKKFPQASFDGVELNDTVYDNIKDLATRLEKTTIHHMNFMEYNKPDTYDLVIGNPPYFVCHKEDIPVRYHSFMGGRPNMFGAFICHSLSLLKTGGILAFVIPKSFMNASYYGTIRKHIIDTCSVVDIIDCEDCSNDFLDTQQTTFIMVVQKGDSSNCHKEKFVVGLGDLMIFTPSASILLRLLAGSTTLKAMGYSVRTGSVVWNEHKAKLSVDSSKTLLIYNTNVVSNQLEVKTFANEEKKQFIDLPGSMTSCLVVNRGNGNSVYKMSYALIPAGREYLVENHLNMITHPSGDYSAIIKSFSDPRTQQFIDCVLGNGALSKTELETVFPVFI